MSNEGKKARERFLERMQSVAVGARLARRSIVWTVTKQVEWATSVELTLRSGRHAFVVNVPVCHSGPILWEVGLRPVARAPMQRELLPAGVAE